MVSGGISSGTMTVLGGRLYQYSAGLASQLSVVAAGSAYVFLEPFTLRLTESEVEGLVLSPETISWLVAIVEAGCLLSPPIAKSLANKYGRKLVILSTGPLCLLSCMLFLFSTSLPLLFLARFLQGLALGVASTVTLIYTAEIAEPEVRGRVSGFFQVAMNLGTLYSFVIGPYLSYWGYIIANIPIPFFSMAAFAFFHDSPYFLLMSGRTEDAERSLVAFRGTSDINKEFEEMRRAVNDEMNAHSSWGFLFGDPFERKAFIMLQIVNIAKYFTGMPTIENYATETFSIGGDILSADEFTIIVGCLLVGTSIVSAFLADYVGRSYLILVSCFGVFVSNLMTGTYFYLQEKTSVCANPFVSLMYVGIIGYCIFINIVLAPLLQTLASEMFSSKTRGLVGSLSGMITSVLCYVVLKTYRPVNDYFGVYFNFWLYSTVSLTGSILHTFFMFETSGKPIGKMNNDGEAFKTKF